MGRPLVTPRFLANALSAFGGGVLFVFLQPWYESTYYGHGHRWVTTARLGLPASPWLTYGSDRAGGRDIGPGLKVAAKSWSWPFLPTGIGLMWLGARIARRPTGRTKRVALGPNRPLQRTPDPPRRGGAGDWSHDCTPV